MALVVHSRHATTYAPMSPTRKVIRRYGALMELPDLSSLSPVGMWVPRAGQGPLHIVLPYSKGNRGWLAQALDKPYSSTLIKWQAPWWTVSHSKVDEMRDALVERFGTGNVHCLVDVSAQRKCGISCQGGNPERAWSCECSCAGENHGGAGAGGGWVQRDAWLIETTTLRVSWLL